MLGSASAVCSALWDFRGMLGISGYNWHTHTHTINHKSQHALLLGFLF